MMSKESRLQANTDELLAKCRDIIAELNTAVGDSRVAMPVRIGNVTRDNGVMTRTMAASHHDRPSFGEEENEAEIDAEIGEEEERMTEGGEVLKGYLIEMEGRVKKAEDQKNAVVEENHQLKLKMKELLTAFTDGTKGNMQKLNNQQASTVAAAKKIEQENQKLRSDLKKSLEEKLELIQKLDKYDKIVEEMKGYNEELIQALKQYEEQNNALRNQKTFSEDEITKIRTDIEKYQKKVPSCYEVRRS